ncbi:hypothetical protein JCM11641_005686 [Rhodosporidiobolus odoratus]
MTAPPPPLPLLRSHVRSPSPTAPPLLRGPSPLGGKSIVVEEDGRIVIAEPLRPASAPAVQPVGPRPPSPGSASTPLRPPVHHARQNSRRELQKIDCYELQNLLQSCLTDFTRLVKAIMKIQSRISRHWTVPQRAVRVKMKQLVNELTTNAAYLVKYFSAVSAAARKILNFIASCIKHTHGLREFTAVQPLKPVTDELRLLHTHWAALERAESSYGDTLGAATLVLEEAMDPDGWTPSAPLTPPILHLATSHTTLLTSFTHLSLFIRDLALSSWHPPLLSPADVKIAAGSWREVEKMGLEAVGEVKRVMVGKEGVWEQMTSMAFSSRSETDASIRLFLAGGVATTASSSHSSSMSPATAGQALAHTSASASARTNVGRAPVERPLTAVGE